MTKPRALEERFLNGDVFSEPVAEVSFEISSVRDVLEARTKARDLALWIGFSHVQAALISVVVSELARNIAQYANSGRITLAAVFRASRHGIVVIARDEGPGIPDLDLAVQEGYSTSGQLGMGLAGVRKGMSEFYITSKVGEGTTVIATKWL